MILNPPARVRILSGGQYTMRLRSLHRAHPSLHPSGVVHWVPEQLNIKAVTGACTLIDGCSLALCSATVSVVSAGVCHRNKVNSIAWFYRRAQPKYRILYITLHYIHYLVACLFLSLFLFSFFSSLVIYLKHKSHTKELSVCIAGELPDKRVVTRMMNNSFGGHSS